MDDLISRLMAINALGEEPEVWTDDDEYSKGMLAQWQYDKRAIESLSSVSEQKTGEWIDVDEQTYTWKIVCSQCGHERSMMSTQGNYPNFCENCGADMRKEVKG